MDSSTPCSWSERQKQKTKKYRTQNKHFKNNHHEKNNPNH